MKQTIDRQVLRTEGVSTGEVLVTTAIEHAELGTVECAAAPLIAASVARAGVAARLGTAAAAPAGDAMLFVTSYIDRDGTTVGLGAAANEADNEALAVARSSVSAWSDALRTRRLLRAAADPLCRGARRALDIAGQMVGAGTVYLYGDLPGQSRPGLTRVSSISEVPHGACILFPAHGVSRSVRAEAVARRLRVIDATCPLAETAQAAVRSFADDGDTVFVLGRSGQAVVEGLVGQAPGRVMFAEAAADLPDWITGRVSYVLQPGVPVNELTPLADTLRVRYQARGAHPGGWCYAASDRAATVRAVAAESDLLLILGDPASADSVHLAGLAPDTHTRIIGDVAEIRPEWVKRATTIGLAETLTTRLGTADLVITAISGIGPLALAERRQITQSTTGHAAPTRNPHCGSGCRDDRPG